MTEPQIAPIRRKKLFEDIVEQLEQMMYTGVLRPGDLLPSERELMERFQVGRTSVREALFALQRMGLVVVRNGERAYVTRPSAEQMVNELSGAARHMLADDDGVREFQHARALMETALARDAARHATAEDIEGLRAKLRENEAALGEPDLFAHTDVEFHLALTRISRNSIFEALHNAVSDWLSEQRITSLRVEGATHDAFMAHERIFTAIEKHDADLAEKEMADHLSEVGKHYWKARMSNR